MVGDGVSDFRRKFRERVEKGPVVVAAGVYDAFKIQGDVLSE